MTSPYLDTSEAAMYLRFLKGDRPDTKGLLNFIARHNAGRPEAQQIRTFKRGRRVLVLREDIESLPTRRSA